MKKYLLLLFLVWLPSWGAVAQTNSLIVDGPMLFQNATSTITRKSASGYVVGHVAGPSGNYFYAIPCNDSTLSAQGFLANVPAGLEVYDMRVDGDYVFCCGFVSSSSQGFCARFQLSALLSGGTFSIEEKHFSLASSPLKRLAVLSNTGTECKVAAVYKDGIVQADFITTANLTALIPVITPYPEQLFDIVKAGGRVYVFGVDETHYTLTVRLFDTINYLGSPLLNQVHWYSGGGDLIVPYGACRAVYMPDRAQIAVVCQSSIGDYPTNALVNIACIGFSSLQCEDRHTLVVQRRKDFRDLAYLETTGRLELLCFDPTNGDTPMLEFRLDEPGGYVANGLVPDERYWSLDRMSGTRFVAGSGYRWFVQLSLPAAWEQSCLPRWQLPILRPQLYSHSIQSNVVIIKNLTSPNVHVTASAPYQLGNSCIH